MGHTVNRQKEAKKDFDYKLSLSHPDRQLLEELAIACATQPSQNATFQYAFALSKSSEPSELRYAINMLDTLVLDGKFQHQVDCMYGAATALYLLGEYDEARSRCESILRTQPDTRIAKELHLACIEAEEERKREQLKQAAVGSIAAAAVVGVIGIASMLLSKKH